MGKHNLPSLVHYLKKYLDHRTAIRYEDNYAHWENKVLQGRDGILRALIAFFFKVIEERYDLRESNLIVGRSSLSSDLSMLDLDYVSTNLALDFSEKVKAVVPNIFPENITNYTRPSYEHGLTRIRFSMPTSQELTQWKRLEVHIRLLKGEFNEESQGYVMQINIPDLHSTTINNLQVNLKEHFAKLPDECAIRQQIEGIKKYFTLSL